MVMLKVMLVIAILFFTHASGIAASFEETLRDAEKGDIYAMHSMGVDYANGETRPQDYAQAFKWFEKAAFRGQHNSMYSLAVMYRLGQGRDVDLVQAYAWYALAAKYIPKNADEWFIPRAKVAMYLNRPGEIASKLSPMERERAQQLYDDLAKQIVITKPSNG
jgi:TPR repeat protein